MAASNRSAAGRGYITMLADRYKQPEVESTLGPQSPGKKIKHKSEEILYSFTQEEELRQDGRTVFKSHEEKSFTGKPAFAIVSLCHRSAFVLTL